MEIVNGVSITREDGATTQILVGGGAGAAPVWTTATGTGAPVRAGSPTFTTQIITPQIYGSAAASGGLALGSTSDGTKGNITVGRMTLSDLANADGIVFGSLGTATKGIDLSSSGLSGSGDYLIYYGANDYWSASGYLKTASTINSGSFIYSASGFRATSDTETITFTANNLVFSAGKNIIGSLISTTGAFFLGNSTAIGSWAADGVSSAGTANITDVGGAAHGLSLAVGDMVHITNCTTASHKGFYRIVTAGATTLVLDRVLAATDTDLTVTFYKDVIGFFATDGTNGQRITGYSHQDKPLQIGGDVLAATGHSLGGEDVLIGGLLEVDGVSHFDGHARFYGNIYATGGGLYFDSVIYSYSDKGITLGSANEAKLLWETADANAYELILALPDGGAVNVPVFVIGDQGIVNVNLGWFDGITEPSIALVNAAENAYVRYGSTVDVSANSTGAGSILMKGTTARDSTGFLAITVTGTTYYIPFFTTITG